VKQIVQARDAVRKVSAGGRATVIRSNHGDQRDSTPTKVGTSPGTAATSSTIGRRSSTLHGTLSQAESDIQSSPAAACARKPLTAKGLYEHAKELWDEVREFDGCLYTYIYKRSGPVLIVCRF
jgi:hypothetical protein